MKKLKTYIKESGRVPKGYRGWNNSPSVPRTSLDKYKPDVPKGFKRVKKGSFWVIVKDK